MKNKFLYNQKNKADLLQTIENETFNRITCSFYKYVNIKNIKELRDKLFLEWSSINILGRIYIAAEGINAQISIPENNFKKLKSNLDSYKIFNKGSSCFLVKSSSVNTL